MTETTTKNCPRCQSTLDYSHFGRHKSQPDGYQQWCKPCTRTYYNEWRVANRSKSKPVEENSFRKFYATLHGRAVHMVNNMRRRAKLKNIECSVSVEWVESKLTIGVCEVTGLPLTIKENSGKGHRTNSFSPSIDRINQSGPYSEENCQLTCWIYNRAKGAFPLEDLQTMLQALTPMRDA